MTDQQNILEMDCRRLRDLIASGRLAAVDAAAAVFDCIHRSDGRLGAYICTFQRQAMEMAASIDRKVREGLPVGCLAGVPVAVKDNIATRFGATTCGSRMLENFKSPYNATVIERLLNADAVIVGKTNMDEFAMGSSTETSALKTTVNPWDWNRVPGGSSGGSAAAVAGRLCHAALGSDTGGSIRQPAGFCGVAGLKPTYGRVSRYGLVAYGSSLDQIGPIARNVADCAIILQAIAGFDSADSTSVDSAAAPVADYLGMIDRPVKDLVLGTVTTFAGGAEPSVRNALKDAVETYAALGADAVELKMPHLDYAVAAYYLIATAEASSNLARYDGVHYGLRGPNAGDCVELYSRSRAEGFGAEVKRRIMLGTYALSSGYYDAYYLRALKVRSLIRDDFAKAFERCRCIVMPVSPTTAFGIGEKMDDPLKMYLSDVYTIAANLAGVPAITVPCGFDENGMPIGLQIIGPAFSEDVLLRIARMYENATDWHLRRPAVCGAEI